MKTLKKIIVRVSGAVLMVGLALNFSACTEQSPFESGNYGADVSQQSELSIIPIGGGFPSLDKGTLTVSQTVTPQKGGKLVLLYGTAFSDEADDIEELLAGEDEVAVAEFGKWSGIEVELEVLPKSVKKKTKLSITLDKRSVDLTFTLHGTVFKNPALLNIKAIGLDLSDANLETLDIYYENPDTGQWERLERDDVKVWKKWGYVKIVNAKLPHFSRYAVAWSN